MHKYVDIKQHAHQQPISKEEVTRDLGNTSDNWKWKHTGLYGCSKSHAKREIHSYKQSLQKVSNQQGNIASSGIEKNEDQPNPKQTDAGSSYELELRYVTWEIGNNRKKSM